MEGPRAPGAYVRARARAALRSLDTITQCPVACALLGGGSRVPRWLGLPPHAHVLFGRTHEAHT